MRNARGKECASCDWKFPRISDIIIYHIWFAELRWIDRTIPLYRSASCCLFGVNKAKGKAEGRHFELKTTKRTPHHGFSTKSIHGGRPQQNQGHN